MAEVLVAVIVVCYECIGKTGAKWLRVYPVAKSISQVQLVRGESPVSEHVKSMRTGLRNLNICTRHIYMPSDTGISTFNGCERGSKLFEQQSLVIGLNCFYSYLKILKHKPKETGEKRGDGVGWPFVPLSVAVARACSSPVSIEKNENEKHTCLPCRTKQTADFPILGKLT